MLKIKAINFKLVVLFKVCFMTFKAIKAIPPMYQIIPNNWSKLTLKRAKSNQPLGPLF